MEDYTNKYKLRGVERVCETLQRPRPHRDHTATQF